MKRFLGWGATLLLAAASWNTTPTLANEYNEASEAEAAAVEEKGPPLPFHSIEGVGGGAITPMAYLVNPARGDDLLGEPAVAMSYVGLGAKNLTALTITENIGGRIELGYAADRLGLGTLPSAIFNATAVDIDRSDVWLHHFNVRFLALKENDWCLGGLQGPAVTFGVDFKFNEGISSINNQLGGALNGIGYDKSYGQDYTLTFSKTLPKALGKPVIVTGGLRASNAANLGFLGFSQNYHVTFEGSVALLATDWLVLAYEFRQKTDPYAQIPGVINGEDNWHAFDAGIILNKHSTLVAGYGLFGTLANSEADKAWWLQFKHEF